MEDEDEPNLIDLFGQMQIEGEKPTDESMTTLEKPVLFEQTEHAVGEDEEHGDSESLVSYFT